MTRRLLGLALLLAACSSSPPSPATTGQPTVAKGSDAPAPEEQPNAEDGARLIVLEGAKNVRDLGGLQGKKPIPKDRVLRTAGLSAATPADLELLAKHQVKLDVDLRTPEEVGKSPDPLAKDPRVKYVNVSLLGEPPLDLTQYHTLGDLYVATLAKSRPQFKQVFQLIAAQPDGSVLYHCSAGKDRTGMVTAILLELAGVDRAAILHNYAISASYLHDSSKEFVQKNPHLAYLIGTPPAEMEKFLKALDAEGGARGYLANIGVTPAEIDALSHRLGQI